MATNYYNDENPQDAMKLKRLSKEPYNKFYTPGAKTQYSTL